MVLAENAGERVPEDTFRDERLALPESTTGDETVMDVDAEGVSIGLASKSYVSPCVKVRFDDPGFTVLNVIEKVMEDTVPPGTS